MTVPSQLLTATPLAGKTAIVTGAGGGIGKAIAVLFASAGANVVIAEINEQAGKQAAAEIQASGGQALFVATDVYKFASVQAMVQAAITRFGGLHIAVNNAAMQCDTKPVSELDENYWNKLISVNFTGVALCLKWELQAMIAQGSGGSIINMASATIRKPGPAYTAAKHGVLGLTRSAAMENGVHKIRVNALSPGGTMTELTATGLEKLGLTEADMASRIGVLGRFAQPEEIAHAALWLVLDTSSYITGAFMPVDAGYDLV
jgi:NAD(P)-dependent dehydrogenase (short-subunit alcohol dehydrogenase family)